MASLLLVVLLAYIFPFTSFSRAESGRKELRNKPTNRDAMIQMVHSLQSRRLDPSLVVSISWQPRNLISDEECDYLISLAHKRTEGNGSLDRLRTFNVKDEVVSVIEQRIAAWTLLPREHSEPLQVIRLASESAYEKYDYFTNGSALASNQPLMATILLYLSNVTKGGGIIFPDSELKDSEEKSEKESWLRPVKGNAVFYFNVRPNASLDTRGTHKIQPVLEGGMWCSVKFFHSRRITLNVGEGENLGGLADGEECVDQDDNCPQWAAMGECKRNLVFMVGSVDYYGTCRKSCKVC